MIKRRAMVAGNWKMNGNQTLVNSFNQQFKFSSENVDVVVCPPLTMLNAMDNNRFSVGAQNFSQLDEGAHTGDVSGAMLKEAGCDFVIVGHSERRADHNESDEVVGSKALKAIQTGLTPIVCFGEPLEVREQGDLFTFLRNQIERVIAALGSDNLNKIVLAYEPIWAIGTGKTASPAQAQEVHEFARNVIREVAPETADTLQILYGGSVKGDNAAELFANADVDGGLIGGASLKLEDFTRICEAAAN